MEDPDLIEEANTRIDRLEAALAGWARVLNYTRMVKAAAQSGTLDPVTNLYPSALVEEVLDLERDVVPGAATTLQKVNTISFVGGGNAYSFEESYTEGRTTHEGTENNDEVWSALIGEFKLTTPAGVGPLTAGSAKFLSGVDRANITSKGTSQQQITGFELMDGDAGDKFVTSIYRYVGAGP